MGKETGSRHASLAACPRMLAILSASPEREAWLDWDDVEREMGSALQSWRDEVERAGPPAEAGPAPVEVSRASSRGWASTSGSERGRRHQGEASGRGQRTQMRGREKAETNYQSDF